MGGGGARYMISSSMGDDIVVYVRQSGHLGLLQVTSDLYRVIICCVLLFVLQNCKLFHKTGIAWYCVGAENCVLASVGGRLLY